MRFLIAILLTACSCLAQGDVEDLMLLRVPEVASGVSPSSLVTNLVAYWRLDEESGTRYDAVGTNHLTDNNTVGYTTGLITNAALTFSNASEYLSAADSDETSLNGSFTVVFAFNHYVTNISQNALSKYGASGDREWYFSLNADSTVSFVLSTNGTTTRFASSTSKPTTNAWHRAMGIYDETAQNFYLVLNGVEFATNSVLAIAAGGTTTTGIRVCRGAAANSYFDGAVDEVGFWKRALSWTEVTNLMNNMSNGLSYPWTGQP